MSNLKSSVKKMLIVILKLLMFCLALSQASPATRGANTSQGNLTAASIENAILHFSYELERLLDVDKRPCQDFFGYVCARSLNTTKLLREQRKQKEQQRFDKFLNTENSDKLLDMETKLKQFYNTCKHRRIHALNGTALYRNVGGWPAIEATNSSANMQRKRRSMSWLTLLSYFHEVGVTYFFEASIEMLSNKRIIHLQPDVLTMRNTLRKYEQLVSDVLREYSVDAARKPLVALETLNFERNRRDIAKANMPDDEVEFSYAEFRQTDFLGQQQQMDWDTYFRKFLGKPLKPTDTIRVKQMPRLKKYFELLQNTTPNRLYNWLWIDYLLDKTINDCEMLMETYFGPVYEHVVQRITTDKAQTAQMYADLGHVYDELLQPSSWIDEISAQNSKQFLGRIIHQTLNGDASLDTEYKSLQMNARNFYRNLENVQRFHAQQRKYQRLSTLNPVDENASKYMQIFLNINALLQVRNLTAPLNYLLVAERFSQSMIASGSSSHTAGAWRSMDSELDFGIFRNCAKHHQLTFGQDLNDLLLNLLAQRQSWKAYTQWLAKDVALQQRLDTLLGAGKLQLTLRRLYFVGSLLVNCQQMTTITTGHQQQQQLVNSALRNTPEFTQTFGCQASDELYTDARQTCKLL